MVPVELWTGFVSIGDIPRISGCRRQVSCRVTLVRQHQAGAVACPVTLADRPVRTYGTP